MNKKKISLKNEYEFLKKDRAAKWLRAVERNKRKKQKNESGRR